MRSTLVAVAVEFATVAVHVTVFASELAALVACGGVIAVSQVSTQLAAIMGDFGFIVADIAMHPAIAVPGKSRCNAHSH